MNKTLLKSIWALLAGFIVVVILSIITDTALMQSGIMKQPLEQNSNFFIGLIVLYRSLFSITGSYITARLAPNKPMRHAMIGGAIGLILGIVGAIVNWDKPPHWYPIALIIVALPCAWLGGKIFTYTKKSPSSTITASP